MEAAGSLLFPLLLAVAAAAAAASRGRDAAEFFQQARFQHAVSRPEDALVFHTNAAPPLVCELERDGDWVGGDRLQHDLILLVHGHHTYYTCSFEGNGTARSYLNQIGKTLPGVFSSETSRKIVFSRTEIFCTDDSQLPDEYFPLRIQRPGEKPIVKCRRRDPVGWLYLRFQGYPTIACRMVHFASSSTYGFNVPGIAGDSFDCDFLVFSEMRVVKPHTEKWLYQSLIDSLPHHEEGDHPHVVCSRYTSSTSSTHFQVRLPGGSIYDCKFNDADDPTFLIKRNNTLGATTNFDDGVGEF